MNARQWLSQLRPIEGEIEALLEARRQEYERLTNVTQNISGDSVSGTKNPHKFDRLAELDDTIDELYCKKVGEKNKIIKAISCVQNTRQRIVLFRRYVLGETFEQIAVAIHYSYKQTCRIHGRALLAITEAMNERL